MNLINVTVVSANEAHTISGSNLPLSYTCHQKTNPGTLFTIGRFSLLFEISMNRMHVLTCSHLPTQLLQNFFHVSSCSDYMCDRIM